MHIGDTTPTYYIPPNTVSAAIQRTWETVQRCIRDFSKRREKGWCVPFESQKQQMLLWNSPRPSSLTISRRYLSQSSPQIHNGSSCEVVNAEPWEWARAYAAGGINGITLIQVGPIKHIHLKIHIIGSSVVVGFNGRLGITGHRY